MSEVIKSTVCEVTVTVNNELKGSSVPSKETLKFQKIYGTWYFVPEGACYYSAFELSKILKIVREFNNGVKPFE